MLASIATFALEGIESREVTVEVDVRRGLPAFTVVGLPDAAVREARERVRAALLNCGLEFPLKRLTANLAPAHLRKAGPSFDLALAVAVLAASEQVPSSELSSYAVCGELSLGGAIRPVPGALAVALGARAAGYRRLVVPTENAAQAALVDGLEVLGVPRLELLVELLTGRWAPPPPSTAPLERSAGELDLADVRGQHDAKRALEIAAAGGHNILLVGPPGAGKTMLARRLPTILPAPSFDEALEITQVQGVAGLDGERFVRTRPFRSPHHTISAPGLVGGGNPPRPGELTLAHRGVLFLDELAEFSRTALEALRQPLEHGYAEVTRGQRTVVFPAKVMLVGACNECPCGRPPSDCDCQAVDHARYRRKLSGPLLDRIDLQCRLGMPAPAELVDEPAKGAEGSTRVRERVAAARERQRARLGHAGPPSNAWMTPQLTRRHVVLDGAARQRMLEGHAIGAMSARGHDRVLRIARTIADLAERAQVTAEDVEEALGFRLAPSWQAAA